MLRNLLVRSLSAWVLIAGREGREWRLRRDLTYLRDLDGETSPGREGGKRRLPKSPWFVSLSPAATFPSICSSRPRLCWVDEGSGEAGEVTRGELLSLGFLVATLKPIGHS